MIYRFPIKTVRDMLLNQISSNYFKSIEDEALISKHFPKAMERFENCIRDCNNKYYSKENDEGIREPYFDPLHTCQWTLFLYFMANTIYKYENEKIEAARVVCDKIYGQSKNMSGCDIYFEFILKLKCQKCFSLIIHWVVIWVALSMGMDSLSCRDVS